MYDMIISNFLFSGQWSVGPGLGLGPNPKDGLEKRGSLIIIITYVGTW
jgi:hypothetical protein